MHTQKYSRKPLILAVCLLVTLALTGVAAWADEWGSGDKTVTVSATDEFAEDIATIPEADKIVVDVIKIASATRNSQYLTYDYALVEPFASDAELAGLFADGKWADVADKAVEIVKNSSVPSVNTVIKDLDTEIPLNSEGDYGDGVYLVLPHGASQEVTALKAYSAVYEYIFNPSIIALPTKDGVDENSALNSAYGAWVPKANIVFKATREPRFGSIEIFKMCVDEGGNASFSGEPETFVFLVTDTATGGEVYKNYASIYYDGTASPASTILNHIPAGIGSVTVEEVYSGARHELTGQKTQEVELKAGEIVPVVDSENGFEHFSNVPNDSGKPGHGIENHFVYKTDEGGGAWSEWIPTPKEETNYTEPAAE